jgi:ATP-dependent DNA helicase RecQ
MTDELASQAAAHLRALAGPDATLRPDQWTAIEALVRGRRRALVVQRTGWGKSAVYFVSTALLRSAGAGPSVIISPLLALMRNQLAAAERAGLRAHTINSDNPDDWDTVYERIGTDQVDLLLVSPERLNNPDFRDLILPKLAAAAGLVVVDEAHCISDWGHDFRPDYRRLRTLLTDLPPDIPVLATTATANARVMADVGEQLSAGNPHEPPLVLRGPLDRDSLHLAVVHLATAEQRLAWLVEHLPALPGSGIIYTLTVADAGDIAAYLRERGHAAVSYTGQTDPDERRRIEGDLLANRVKAVVATTAPGMGYDKPDLGFVLHVGAPQSPVAYYQQIGRAGRGVRRAEVVLLPGSADREIWAYFGSLAFPPEHIVRATLAALADADRPLSTSRLEPLVDLSRTRLETMLKVLDVDGAVTRVRGGWRATDQPWRYDAERYARVAHERSREQQAMLGYLRTTSCRMEYLRRELDDPDAAPCGRCDNCTGRHWPATVDAGAVSVARQRLDRPGIAIPPRRQWPTGMAALGVDISGRIPESALAEPGQALGRLTDAGWGSRLRPMLADDAADNPPPPDVLAAVVAVLANWQWPARPAAVVTVPSRRRPTLIGVLAERIAAAGRLPYLGELSGVAGPHRLNSAQRLAGLWRAFAIPTAMRTELAGLSGPVLLVDDLVDTRWTMTVVTRLLRAAGAPGVLPFALAVTA